MRLLRPALLAAAALACGAPTALPAPATTAAAHSDPLLIGEFTVTKVVDGDTIRVAGLDASLRLIGIDTEEIFHHAKDRRQLDELGWDAYLAAQRGDATHPVKMATPMGEDAKKFAASMFPIGATVRLERDDARQIHDRYGRYLAYVFVEKDGAWVNYNVEAVRAGMSPYFMKYGWSRRFDADFRAAEAEAKAAHRGIWSDATQHYPDYAERAAWWTARADFVARFEQDAAGRDDVIDLTDDDALDRLAARTGRTTTVLGTIGRIYRDKGPVRVMLSRRKGLDLPLVFFDRHIYAATGLDDQLGEFVRVTGEVSTYTNPHNHRTTLEIVVRRADQVTRERLSGSVRDDDRDDLDDNDATDEDAGR